MQLRPDPTRASAHAAVCADLFYIGRVLKERRLHLRLLGGGITFASAPHADGRESRDPHHAPEDLARLVELHTRRLRRLALLVPPAELTRLLCSLFAPLPEGTPERPGFELHQGVRVSDPERWRRAMIRDVEQGPHGPRYRTGALGRDLEALERITFAGSLTRTPTSNAAPSVRT